MPKRSKLDHFYDLPANFLLASFVYLVASGPDGRMCAVLAAGSGFTCCPGCCRLRCLSLSSIFILQSVPRTRIRTGVPDSVPYRRYLQNGISSFFILQNYSNRGLRLALNRVEPGEGGTSLLAGGTAVDDGRLDSNSTSTVDEYSNSTVPYYRAGLRYEYSAAIYIPYLETYITE